jgi:hypothetical protein
MTIRRLDTVGTSSLRDASEGEAPSRIEGVAIPYGVDIRIAGGRERFRMGSFADQVTAVRNGERLAFLNRHGLDGGVSVAVVDHLEERADGLHFGANIINVREAESTVAQISNGVNGISAEFIPGKTLRKGDLTEHTAGVRLAAIAASYAPAYVGARASLRDASQTGARRIATVPNLSVEALRERRTAIDAEASTIRTVAETEGRDLTTEDRDALTSIEGRRANIDSLITSAEGEAQRRDAERAALPSRPVGTGAVVTRAETVYGPGTGHSFFADLTAATKNRDSDAIQRMGRHRALITDLVGQMEQRAIDSSEIAGAYPTQYYPDLYVPDIAYAGPLSSFFATTPITSPNPIIVPTFATVTGDTDVQTAENAPLASVEVSTAPKTLTPKTIGGETIVSRQAVDGASPGADVIISNQLRELLMRDTEREIALVLEALTSSGAIADTAGLTNPGADLHKGVSAAIGTYYAGAAAGGAGARMLPPEGVFLNSKSWGDLVAGFDSSGRQLLAYINPVNALGQVTGAGFQKATIGGVVVEPAWALLANTNEIIARRNDARQWKSAVLDIRLTEREGPQSIVFAIWQYFGFAVLEPKGVRRYTYTNA